MPCRSYGLSMIDDVYISQLMQKEQNFNLKQALCYTLKW